MNYVNVALDNWTRSERDPEQSEWMDFIIPRKNQLQALK